MKFDPSRSDLGYLNFFNLSKFKLCWKSKVSFQITQLQSVL